MSWKPEVRVGKDPKWYDNALRFETEDEARRNADDLGMRWTSVVASRAAESSDPVNYVYTKEGKLVAKIEGHM